MTSQEVIVFGAFAAVILALLICVVRIWLLVKQLNTSFAKLGFLVREDAKKYFDDAADKIVDTNEQFQEMYKKIVEEGTRSVMAESSVITSKVMSTAYSQANKIILGARTDAQQIIQEAKKEAESYSDKTLNRTGDAIAWVISQYLGEKYSVREHEALIEKQVRMYVDEHKK